MNRFIILIIVLAIFLLGCASTKNQTSQSDFEELCTAIGKKGSGKISKEELLAAVKDKEQAERIFNLCDTNKDAYLTVEEAARQSYMMRELIRLTPPPTLKPSPKVGR